MLRPQFTNVPIEVIRSFVMVADCGSLSKAAKKLGVTQPTISAQMKRLQSLVGGSLFTRGANGTALTELGKLALQQARRVIEAVEQMLALTGSSAANAPLRLGISALLLPALLRTGFDGEKQNVFMFSDHSREVKRGLIEGYIDVACAFMADAADPELRDSMFERRSIPLVWLRSRSFTFDPGRPLPIIAIPEDEFMIRPLRVRGQPYRIVLNTPDVHARFAAIRAGMGICAVPQAAATQDLVAVTENYVPKLPPAEACIFLRPDFDRVRAMEVVVYLKETLETFATPTKLPAISVAAG
jgi:DNA-binding transcriptional LysR family regulator